MTLSVLVCVAGILGIWPGIRIALTAHGRRWRVVGYLMLVAGYLVFYAGLAKLAITIVLAP